MRDEEYRSSAWERRYDGARGQFNRLIDELIASSGEPMPYSGPEYGGVNAEALLLLQDPGPKTQFANEGSGFLSIENDDPSAELLSEIFGNVGLAPSRLVSWNTYPWYINRTPTEGERRRGVEPLRTVLEALPNCRAVVLMGSVSQKSWSKHFKSRYASRARQYQTFDCLLCSGRGIINGGQHSRAEGIDRVTAVYRALHRSLDREASA